MRKLGIQNLAEAGVKWYAELDWNCAECINRGKVEEGNKGVGNNGKGKGSNGWCR